MSNFLWILLLVLFSLPSLLGKKEKNGRRERKVAESDKKTSGSTVYTDIEETLHEILGKKMFSSAEEEVREFDKKTTVREREQFLYNEYNPKIVEEEPKKQEPVAETAILQSDIEDTRKVEFNLREAVVYSVVLENPYIAWEKSR